MNVRLRKLENKDCDGMLEWMHDEEVMHSFRKDMRNRTREDVLKFIENAKDIPANGEDLHYAVVDESDEYMGTISLKAFNEKDGNAEYAISLRRKFWGKGVGQSATEKLLEIAFQKMNLERVYLNVLANNERAIRLYEKCGFQMEGEFKKHLYLEGGHKNLKWYAMLKEDYIEIKNILGGGVIRN